MEEIVDTDCSKRTRIAYIKNDATKRWLVTLKFVIVETVLISIVICELVVLYQPIIPVVEDIMCTPSSTLGNINLNLTSQLKHKVMNITEDGIVKYCGKVSDVIKWTNQMMLNDIYNHPEFPFYTELLHESCVATNRTSVILNLTEINMDRTKEQSGKQSKIYWNQSSASPGLSYSKKEDCVIIKNQGLYRVKSHLMFNLDLDCSIVRQSLNLRRNKTDEIILEYVNEACDTGEESGNKSDMTITSEWSSVFRFENGDLLFMTTSHSGHLTERSTHNNYFIIIKFDV